MKNKVKNYKKAIIACVICSILFGTIGVSASTLLYSKDVTYDNSSSGMSATTVQDALDELYEQAKNAPECDSEGNCTVVCPNDKPYYVATSTGYKCSKSSTYKLLNNVVTSGSGLYADSVTSERYIYRGLEVNNYITFNDEIWRIISVENNGTLKIIRNEQLSSTQTWDARYTRSWATSTYCSDSDHSCNAWAATKNLVGTPSTFVQGTYYSGTVIEDASLNTSLNGYYYNNLSATAQSKVVTGIFNVSTPDGAETLEASAQQEKKYQWQGKIALMNVTELLRASTNSECTSLTTESTCSNNNWLWPTFNTNDREWTLSPSLTSSRAYVWFASSNRVSYTYTEYSYGIRPVLHLSSDITLSGSGTQSDPYTIN